VNEQIRHQLFVGGYFLTFSGTSGWVAFPNENVVKTYKFSQQGQSSKGEFEILAGVSFSSGIADSIATSSLFNQPQAVLAYYDYPKL